MNLKRKSIKLLCDEDVAAMLLDIEADARERAREKALGDFCIMLDIAIYTAHRAGLTDQDLAMAINGMSSGKPPGSDEL
jgi:hypothetical protein